jgi:hypothetical protein
MSKPPGNPSCGTSSEDGLRPTERAYGVQAARARVGNVTTIPARAGLLRRHTLHTRCRRLAQNARPPSERIRLGRNGRPRSCSTSVYRAEAMPRRRSASR